MCNPALTLSVELSTHVAAPGEVVTAIVRDSVPMYYVYLYFEDHFLTWLPVNGGYKVEVRFVVPEVKPGNYAIMYS